MTPTLLCIATYRKGDEFLRECRRRGCRVLLLTDETLSGSDWPRDAIDDTFFVRRDMSDADIRKGAAYLVVAPVFEQRFQLRALGRAGDAVARPLELRLVGQALTHLKWRMARFGRRRLHRRCGGGAREPRDRDQAQQRSHRSSKTFIRRAHPGQTRAAGFGSS